MMQVVKRRSVTLVGFEGVRCMNTIIKELFARQMITISRIWPAYLACGEDQWLDFIGFGILGPHALLYIV